MEGVGEGIAVRGVCRWQFHVSVQTGPLLLLSRGNPFGGNSPSWFLMPNYPIYAEPTVRHHVKHSRVAGRKGSESWALVSWDHLSVVTEGWDESLTFLEYEEVHT